MIVFDLKCSAAHVFEAWFGSSADYEAQAARGLVACPICGDTQTGKAVMAPAVAPKGNRSRPPALACRAAHDPGRGRNQAPALWRCDARRGARA